MKFNVGVSFEIFERNSLDLDGLFLCIADGPPFMLNDGAISMLRQVARKEFNRTLLVKLPKDKAFCGCHDFYSSVIDLTKHTISK